MSRATLRLYGRFVLAQPLFEGKPLPTAKVLLPNMTHQGTVSRRKAGTKAAQSTDAFHAHDVLLTIPRNALSLDEVSMAPAFRLMSDDRANYAELLCWNLRGTTIAIDGDKSFGLDVERDTTFVDLTNPVEGFQFPPDIVASSLEPSRDGITSAVVDLQSGSAMAFATFPNAYNFVTWSDADAGEPNKHLGVDRRHADVVEVAIPPTDGSRVRLRVTTIDGRSDNIWVETKAFTPTVGITNLCPALPHRFKYDFEFTQYYHYLDSAFVDPPIPKIVPTASDPGDCNEPVFMAYRVK
jgi:hypothetical protein